MNKTQINRLETRLNEKFQHLCRRVNLGRWTDFADLAETKWDATYALNEVATRLQIHKLIMDGTLQPAAGDGHEHHVAGFYVLVDFNKITGPVKNALLKNRKAFELTRSKYAKMAALQLSIVQILDHATFGDASDAVAALASFEEACNGFKLEDFE